MQSSWKMEIAHWQLTWLQQNTKYRQKFWKKVQIERNENQYKMEHGFNTTESCKNKRVYFLDDKNTFVDKGNAAFNLNFR